MGSDVTVIVPAAGLGNRFKEAGYKTPKPMIRFEYGGEHTTMLQHVVHSVVGTKRDVVVGVHEDFIRETASTWPIYRKVPIQHTQGQADTIYQILRFVEGPVLIVNSDAALHVPADIWGQTGFCLETLCFDVGHLDKLPYEESPYSHVDNAPIFDVMAEKIYLSQYACAGAWYYYDATELRALLKISLGKDPGPNGEYYLSTALSGGGYAHVLAEDQYRSWNTPEDLEADPLVSDIRKG